jgi:adenylate cyclase
MGVALPPLLRSVTVRHLRLASGQVMWFYICAHFLNHSLGLVSLGAAEAALKVAAAVWQSLPGTVLLYGAFVTHVSLAMYGLHQRHTLRLPPLELARILFGLTIPLLLFGHVVATRVAYEWYGAAAQYQRVVSSLARDGSTGWQLALLAPGWLHGCMGLNVALRHRAWYQRWRGALLALVVALPLLAAAGYVAMIRDVAALGPGIGAPPSAQSAAAAPAQRQALAGLRVMLLTGYLSLLALVLGSRFWRDWRDWRESRKMQAALRSQMQTQTQTQGRDTP